MILDFFILFVPLGVFLVNLVAFEFFYLRCELTLCSNPAHIENARKLDPP